ncbi:MAG: iron-containing alcohol dehydrogenase [Spirochaetes bacterium]|nr:iron-containing alcohol dehydrogenase [Spirochaetota bacterium]
MNGGISYNFYIPTEIYINQNIVGDIGGIIKKFGTKAVLITTTTDFARYSDVIGSILKDILKTGTGCIVYDEIPEIPDTEYIDSAVYFTKKTNCDIIIGFGGIESINAAKATALLTNNHLFCSDVFEAHDLNPPVPCITIPTQPIFGFEILPMFFIDEIHEMTKKVYKSRNIFPKAAIIDSTLATTLNDEKTAESAISVLAISTESVISKINNELMNTYALKSIDLIFKNLPLAYRDPKDPAPKYKLSVASLLAGMTFSISELSLTLAIALAISSRSKVSLNKAMGIILPHVMEYNLTTSSNKYVQMSKVMDENIRDITVIEAAIKAVEGVRKLENEIDMPQRLSQFDIPKTEFANISQIAISYPFIQNAPRPLNRDEIETILIAAY